MGRCVNASSKLKLLQVQDCFHTCVVNVLSPHVRGSCATRKRNHPPQFPQLPLLPPLSVSPSIQPLISSSNCQFPKAARSATKNILGWLSCKAVKENLPKLFTISATPSLYFSVTPWKNTGGQLHCGRGILESPAGTQWVRNGKAMDPGCHNPSHSSSHQLTLQFDATGVIQEHRLLPTQSTHQHPADNTSAVSFR